VKDGSFENPLPRSWAGDCFFRCLLSLSASVSGAGVSFLNVGMAESSGVEAGFQVLLLWQLRLDGSYMFPETKVIQDGGSVERPSQWANHCYAVRRIKVVSG
jgi:hypothetical protein